jgi:hypothetical protein
MDRKLAEGQARRLAMSALIRDQVLRPLHLHWAEVATDPELKRRYLMSAISR